MGNVQIKLGDTNLLEVGGEGGGGGGKNWSEVLETLHIHEFELLSIQTICILRTPILEVGKSSKDFGSFLVLHSIHYKLKMKRLQSM